MIAVLVINIFNWILEYKRLERKLNTQGMGGGGNPVMGEGGKQLRSLFLLIWWFKFNETKLQNLEVWSFFFLYIFLVEMEQPNRAIQHRVVGSDATLTR